MSTYAVVKLGPSQQKVSVGDVVVTDRLQNAVGDKITVSDVLLLSDGENVTVGTPLVNTSVEFEVVSHVKGEKVRIHRFKAKSRYKKTNGFRASLTTLKVLSIGSSKSEKKAEEVKAEKPAKKTSTKSTKKA